MDNLKVYNAVRTVPPTAKKDIQAGRLKGKTDINPMWRIKALTEQFGMVGIGWYYEITEKRLEAYEGTGEVAAFVDINLYVKVDGEWSKPIQGTGGSSFVAKEKNGPYLSDECFKMALTDAISVSCKALGFGADVYWDKDNTKYSKPQDTVTKQSDKPTPSRVISPNEAADLLSLCAQKGVDIKRVMAKYEIAELGLMEFDMFTKLVSNIEKMEDKK